MQTKALFAASLILFSYSLSVAQDNNWQLILASGDTISNVSLQVLEGDTVAVILSDTVHPRRILVDSIFVLRKIKESKYWKGAAIGTLTGMSAGALIGFASYSEPEPEPEGWSIRVDFGRGGSAFFGGILGGLMGFVLGGIVGTSAGVDEIYDLSASSHNYKVYTILALLKEKNE